MGHVEQLDRYFKGAESVSEDQLKERLQILERDVRRSWETYKNYQEIMHGERVQDNGLRMVLLWMLRKGILK